jgi:hypothetical protein
MFSLLYFEVLILAVIILWRIEKMATTFMAALAQLTTDVQTLINEGSPAAIATAVAAKDASDAAAVNALDQTVKAALTPPATS